MTDYTPTTDDIKSIWRSRYDSEHHWAVGEELRGYEAEFDRWLEQVKSEAWEEGFSAGVDLGTSVAETMVKVKPSPLPRVPDNPYRQNQNSHRGNS